MLAQGASGLGKSSASRCRAWIYCRRFASWPAPTRQRIRALDGTDITALLEGNPFRRTNPLYWHYYRSISRPKVAMRVGDWMILASTTAEQPKSGSGMPPGDMETLKTSQLTDFELYNERDDIGEQHDLAVKEPERLRDLSTILVQRSARLRPRDRAGRHGSLRRRRVQRLRKRRSTRSTSRAKRTAAVLNRKGVGTSLDRHAHAKFKSRRTSVAPFSAPNC